MIRLVQRKLIIPRGDTGSFTIPAINDISQSSVAVFTIFDPLTHGKVMQKVLNATDNAFVVEFNHSDTVNLPVGDFVWDIKFYANPVFADGELIDGEEIDSYYAAFKLPVCEIRQTGDNLIMSDRAPQGTLAPDQIDMLTAVANEAKAATEQARAATEATQEVADVAREVNEKFDSLAEWVKEPEKPVYTYDEVGALAANTFIPSKVSDLTDDSGHYVKPVTGIPASDLEEEYLTEHQDLSNYVQKTDYATNITAGVVKVNSDNGLTIASGQLKILAADADTVKSGSNIRRPLVPSFQHSATFYGLAKSAGDTTQSQSDNPVGTYTDEAKAAIQTMLDVPSKSDIPEVPVQDVQINNTSILNNGIANIPVATTSQYGVMQVGPGLNVMNNGSGNQVVSANFATGADIKAGKSTTGLIRVSHQYESAFYGLARAAGANEKDSTLPVGQYTDAAKAAIQAMLDVPSTADIPTNVSELTNDVGYLTEHQDISGKANVADLAAVATSGSYNDLEDKPTIPEVPVQDVQVNGTSALDENGVANIPVGANGVLGVVKAQVGEGILISSGTLKLSTPSSTEVKNGDNGKKAIVPYNQHNATFYGLAKAAGVDEKNSELPVGQYTDSAKTAIQQMLDVPSTSAVTSEIATAIGNINSFDMAVVQELPLQDISTHTIYLVPKTGETNDVYDEYVYINNAWEMVGNTQIDLSNYVQKTDYASDSNYGVVQTDTNFGINSVNGVLSIGYASTSDIKAATNYYKPIGPRRVKHAAFYGLAQAAGDTTQSQSDNAVGTYTTEAQAAIQNMLDVPAKADIPDLSNYVQKTDYATANEAGVVKIDSSSTGLNITPSGILTTKTAALDQIKAGASGFQPIQPGFQHASTFYGLAKAAGDTTQSQSSNTVGTYTNEAKAAIQTMLDVPSNADLSLKADKTDTVLETTLSRGRKDNTTIGGASLAFGVNTEASGYYSVALGLNTTASSQGAYAEGKGTVAHYIAHAEGEDSQALSSWSHAQNLGTIANGGASSASGRHTIANGADSFVFGKYNAEDSYDNWPTWTANTSYEIGDRVKRNLMVQNEPTDVGYHCTVANNDATFDVAHWELDGYHMNYVEIVGNGNEYEDPETHQTVRAGSNAYALEWNGTGHFAGDVYVGANADSSGGEKVATSSEIPVEAGTGEGSVQKKAFIVQTGTGPATYRTTASGTGSNAEGTNTIASGWASHAEGQITESSNNGSHAEGTKTIASGDSAHAEGQWSIASGDYSHAEGGYTNSNYKTIASGRASHAEGTGTLAVGDSSHAEGSVTQANGIQSHAEGLQTIANGRTQHVSGKFNIADSYDNWVEWEANTSYSVNDKVKVTITENNETSITGYVCKTANSDAEFTASNWTKDTYINYVEIIGNGTLSNRSNAFALDWEGNGHYMKDIYVGCNTDSTGGTKVATVVELATKLDAAEAGLKVVRLI